MTAVFKTGDRVRVKETARLIKKVLGTVGIVQECCPGWCTVSLEAMRGENYAFDYGDLEPAPTSSPDTPESRAAGERDALRTELLREIGRLHSRFPLDAELDVILPIIDRHTAKALETALRERDEARADVGDLTMRHAKLFDAAAYHQDRTRAAESALAFEQSTHAETRAELATVRKALADEIAGRDPCPFDRPSFDLALDTPCPVCGDLGHVSEIVSRCVSPPKPAGRSALSNTFKKEG